MSKPTKEFDAEILRQMGHLQALQDRKLENNRKIEQFKGYNHLIDTDIETTRETIAKIMLDEKTTTIGIPGKVLRAIPGHARTLLDIIPAHTINPDA